MLRIKGLHAYYGKSHVLHGVDMEVKPGEIVSLLGRNGSGRSTTIKAIMGLVHGEGSVCWNGEELLGQKTYDIARKGLGYVPESRDVFPGLTVEQNLKLGQKTGHRDSRWRIDDMYRMFPRLKERQHTEAPGAQDRRARGAIPRGVAAARLGRAAGRAKAHHRARHLAALLCDGPRRSGLRRHARSLAGRPVRAQGVARSLMACLLDFP